MNMLWLRKIRFRYGPSEGIGIRKKIFLINFSLLVVLMLLISAFNRYQVRYAIGQEEYRQLLDAKSQFISIQAKEQDFLSKSTRDWSEWEDAFDFLRGKEHDFVAQNLNDSTLSILNISHLVYYGLDKEPKATLSRWKVGAAHNFQDSIQKYVEKKYWELPSDGYLEFQEKLFRFTWKSVKSPTIADKIAGKLLFVKEITPQELQELSRERKWNIKVGECRDNLDSLRCQNVAIKTENNGIFYLNIENQSTLQELSNSLEYSQTFGLLLLAGLFAVLVWWFIERNLLKRIVGLSRSVEQIIQGQKVLPIDVSRQNDEIGLLATRIKEMVVESQTSHDELAKALKKMEEAQRVRNTFFALMSHDLRTPLNGVIGMASILLRNDPRPAQREGLEMMQGAAEALLSSLNDILDFAKIGQERIELSQDIVSLENCLESTLRILSLEAHRKKLVLTLQMDADLPATVLLDEQRFRQIINNLTSNAIKFTDDGEVIVQVRMLEKHEDFCVLHFSVKDQGCGIPESRQDEIFRPFVHGNEANSSQTGGVGLGLTIAEEIASSMGSTIHLKSTVGVGTEFYFDLRIAIPKHAEEICPARSSQADRIDEISILSYSQVLATDIQEKLLRQGYQSKIFPSWDSLLREQARESKKIWIVDSLCLPGERLFVFKENADRLQGVGLILLTDSSRIYDPEDASEQGIASVLRKPFAPSALLELVRNEVRTSIDVYLWTNSPFLSLLTQGVLAKRGHRVFRVDSLQLPSSSGVVLVDSEELEVHNVEQITALTQQAVRVILLGKCAPELRLPKGVIALHKPVESSALIDAVEHVQSDSVREHSEELGIYIG